jgi:RNA polymerase sigma factor (sigma-70 family)
MSTAPAFGPIADWLDCLADDSSDHAWPARPVTRSARVASHTNADASRVGVGGRRVALDDRTALQLAERVRDGDEQAFQTIYLAFFRPLWEFAYSLCDAADVAEDIVQDVFANWWERSSTADIRVGLDPYLYGAVRHRALSWRRQTSFRTRDTSTVRVIAEHAGLSAEVPAADVKAQENEFARALAEAVDSLPAARRTAFMLRVRHGLEYSAIGEIMDISAQAAMIHVSRARNVLRQLFERYYRG